MVLVMGAAADFLAPPFMAVEYARQVWTNSTHISGSPCFASPALSIPPTTQMWLVNNDDNWTSIANKSGITEELLLRTNNVGSKLGNFITPDLVPGTFIKVKAPPTLAPLCPCPVQYNVLSDDTYRCLSSDPLLLGASVLRVVSGLPEFATAQIDEAAAAWVPAQLTLVSDMLINLQILSEIFNVDLALTRTSAIPETIALSVATVGSTNSFAEAQSLNEYSWQPFLVFSTQCTSLPASPTCIAIGSMATATLPVNAAGFATIQGNMIRARVFRNPASSTLIKVCNAIIK